MSYFEFDGKNVFYQEIGDGRPLLLLHGNTASSKMFEPVIEMYTGIRKVVLIDFLGHGRSQRLERFPADLWFYESQLVVKLIEHLRYDRVDLIGSSGGALVAINVALERPDLVGKVVADSFEGEVPLEEFVANAEEERRLSKEDADTRAFYEFNHGDGWDSVVDNDTRAVIEHANSLGRFFHRPFETECEILMTGSETDEFVYSGFYEKTYSKLLKGAKNGKVRLFNEGGHPAMLSNAKPFFEAVRQFLG